MRLQVLKYFHVPGSSFTFDCSKFKWCWSKGSVRWFLSLFFPAEVSWGEAGRFNRDLKGRSSPAVQTAGYTTHSAVYYHILILQVWEWWGAVGCSDMFSCCLWGSNHSSQTGTKQVWEFISQGSYIRSKSQGIIIFSRHLNPEKKTVKSTEKELTNVLSLRMTSVSFVSKLNLMTWPSRFLYTTSESERNTEKHQKVPARLHVKRKWIFEATKIYSWWIWQALKLINFASMTKSRSILIHICM